MTEANQKRLYDHFVDTEQFDKAEEVLKVYPHFKVVEPEPAKSKGKK